MVRKITQSLRRVNFCCVDTIEDTTAAAVAAAADTAVVDMMTEGKLKKHVTVYYFSNWRQDLTIPIDLQRQQWLRWSQWR